MSEVVTRGPERATVVAFACPRCQGPVDEATEAYRCERCAREYPVVAGIPDFRLRPDPWIGIAEDREKALRVAEATRDLPFTDAVRTYWAMTPSTPRGFAERFERHVVGAVARSREWLAAIGGRSLAERSAGPWIDLGCGTGDLGVAGRELGLSVVGIDIALRWLVIARRRPELAGTLLVCCAAEQLPFPDRSFGGGFSIGLLEHCPAPEPVAREARRVLAPGSRLRLRTVNRFSILGEPHVGLWGVGFLPRRYADAYVRWRTGQGYLHHRPVSPRELRRALRQAGFPSVRVEAARPLQSETAALGPVAASLGPLYDAGRRTPGLRTGLRWAAPALEAEATA